MQDPSQRVVQAVRNYSHNLSCAVNWIHPSWYGRLPDRLAQTLHQHLHQADASALQVCSQMLVRAYSIATPDVTYWARALDGIAHNSQPASGWTRLFDAVPVPLALKLLRVRALMARAREVRLLIDAGSRRRLTEWTGVNPGTLPSSADTLTGTLVGRKASVLSLTEIDDLQLAIEGQTLLGLHTGPNGRSACPGHLLTLALPDSRTCPDWLAASDGLMQTLDARRLLLWAGQQIPELAWLSG